MEFPALASTGILPILSEAGKRIYLPQGIFHWSGRASEEADINATIGSATGRMSHLVPGGGDNEVVLHLPMFAKMFADLKPAAVFGYAKVLGLPAFRSAWKEYILRKAGARAANIKDLITLPAVTPGVTGGLHYAIRLFLDPSEPLVSPELRWENYDNIVTLNFGGTTNSFPLFANDSFNTDGMAKTIRETLKTANKAVVLLNFPNNPTGFIPKAEQGRDIINTLVKIAEETGKWIVAVCDDAYEGYVYEDGLIDGSLFYDLVGVHPRVLPVKLDGVTKEMLWYGGRVGCMTFGLHPDYEKATKKGAVEKELMDKMGGLVRTTVSNCNHPVQAIIAKSLEKPDELIAERNKTLAVLKRRCAVMKAEIRKHDDPSLLKWLPFNSGFFAFALCDQPNAMAELLLKKYRVGIIPDENGELKGIRMAFCSVEEEQLPKLVESVYAAARDLKEGKA